MPSFPTYAPHDSQNEMSKPKVAYTSETFERERRAELNKWVSSIAPEIKVVGGYVCQKSGYSIQVEKPFYEKINSILAEVIYTTGKEHLYPYCLGLLLSRITPTYEKASCYFCKKEVKEKEWYKQSGNVYHPVTVPAVSHKKCYEYVLNEQKAKKFVDESAKEIPDGSEVGGIIVALKKARKI